MAPPAVAQPSSVLCATRAGAGSHPVPQASTPVAHRGEGASVNAREALLVSGALLTQHATAFATNVVIGRALGPGALGELSVLRSLSAVLLIITPLGLDAALLKHASLYQNRQAELGALTLTLRLLVVGINTALLLLAFWLGPALGTLYGSIRDFDRLVVLAMAGVVFAADLQISGALYQAAGRTARYFFYASYIQYTMRMILSVAAVAAGGGVLAIVAINTAVAAGTFALMELDRRKLRSRGAGFPFLKVVPASVHILSESVWMCGALLLYNFMRLVDVLVLGLLTTPDVTGQYSAMSMVAQIIAIYPNAISVTLGPRIAVLYAAGDLDGIRREVGGYLRKASLLGGFLLGGVAVFGTDLDLVFGSAFAFPLILVVLLAAGWYVSAILAPLGFVLSMTGRHRQELGILAAGSLLLVLCLFAFVPWLKGTGAALAVAATFVFVNIVRARRVIRVLGRNPLSLLHLAPPAAFVGLAACCSVLGDMLGRRSFLLLFVECVAYSVLSFVLYLLLFAHAEDHRATLRIPFGRTRAG